MPITDDPSEAREYLLFFRQPIAPNDARAPVTLRMRDTVTRALRLAEEGRDGLLTRASRADRPIARAELIVHLPDELADTVIGRAGVARRADVARESVASWRLSFHGRTRFQPKRAPGGTFSPFHPRVKNPAGAAYGISSAYSADLARYAERVGAEPLTDDLQFRSLLRTAGRTDPGDARGTGRVLRGGVLRPRDALGDGARLTLPLSAGDLRLVHPLGLDPAADPPLIPRTPAVGRRRRAGLDDGRT